MKTGNIIVGVLAGFAAGAVLGILFAPDKGTETRKKIKRTGKDYVDAVKEKMDELTHILSAQTEHLKEEAENLVQKGKDQYQNVKSNIKEATA